MKKIAIIGGGIIGLTLVNYLDTTQYEITLFDEGIGQATGASAGIISPWLSKRRNKKWYQLAKDGASFFPTLVKDLGLTKEIYSVCGTIILREAHQLQDLAQLAEKRKETAPEIGEIQLLSGEETQQKNPLLKPLPSLFISGGGRLDGREYLKHLTQLAMNKGVNLIKEPAQLEKIDNAWLVTSPNHQMNVDQVAVTAGPSIKPLLEKIGYSVDIRPQKGQLLVYQTDFPSGQWPVVMLDGEADFIPFEDGKILIGATHENEAGWDLTPTSEAVAQLVNSAQPFLEEVDNFRQVDDQLVGTRAYTSDFAPFFGPLAEDSSIAVASGLGSSGLTTGPYIGYLLAKYFNQTDWNTEHYQKPITQYVQKK